MSRCVNEVENILFPIFCLINDTDCLGFDRDSTFSLKIHIVKHLCLHLTACECSGTLYDTICQR